jgi:hypothetical protein
MPWPSHPSWVQHSNYTWRRVKVMKLLVMQFLRPPVTSSLLGPNIFLSTLFSKTLSLCFSLNVRDHVPHPYRTTGKIIVLYILILGFRQQTRRQMVLVCIAESVTRIQCPLLSSWIKFWFSLLSLLTLVALRLKYSNRSVPDHKTLTSVASNFL